MPSTKNKAIFTLIAVWLVATTAHAKPLSNSPSLIDVAHRIEPNRLTFLCHCEQRLPRINLDTTGCAIGANRPVIGNVVPTQFLLSIINKNTNINNEALQDILIAIQREPLNLTVFADSVWDAYKQASVITGTSDIGGSFGACPFKTHGNTAYIPDGKLGEFARTALYLIETYRFPANNQKVKHLQDIAEATLPTARELVRNDRANEWNGSWNHYIEENPNRAEHYTQEFRDGIMSNINRFFIDRAVIDQ